MPKQSFMRGAAVLTSASLITRFLDMIIQIVVARELGAAAFGLFRTVNPIFYLLLTISTLALPPALSKVIAENMAIGNVAKVRRALQVSNTVVVILSVIVCLGAIAFIPLLSNQWLDPRATLPFLGALLRIPVVGLYSVLSGYYLGVQNQTPPAIAWILETVVRTAVTVPLILHMNHFGIAYGALGVMVGTGIGELAGYLYMLYSFRKEEQSTLSPQGQRDIQSKVKGTIRDLAEVALPTTVRNIVSIIVFAIEPIVVYVAFEHAGFAKEQATILYGSFGMAIQLLFIPTVLSSSLSSVILPAVSEAAAVRNTRLISRRLNQVIQLTVAIALPATVFLMLSGHDLATTLYRDPLAGALLAYLAPMCVFAYVEEPLFAVLQGLNKATLSVLISLGSSAVRIVAIYYFVGGLHDGIYGVAKAAVISGIVSTLLSLVIVRRFVPVSLNLKNLAKMIIATAIATVPIYHVHTLLPANLTLMHVLVSFAAGCLAYTVALIYLRALPMGLVRRIPWVGHFAAGLLHRMPFVR